MIENMKHRLREFQYCAEKHRTFSVNKYHQEDHFIIYKQKFSFHKKNIKINRFLKMHQFLAAIADIFFIQVDS